MTISLVLDNPDNWQLDISESYSLNDGDRLLGISKSIQSVLIPSELSHRFLLIQLIIPGQTEQTATLQRKASVSVPGSEMNVNVNGSYTIASNNNTFLDFGEVNYPYFLEIYPPNNTETMQLSVYGYIGEFIDSAESGINTILELIGEP